MSTQFSDTTQKDGLIQICERRLKLGDGFISGTNSRLREFTSELNLGLARAWALIFNTNGTWQWDDSNHTADYPIITTDLVSGQRDYAFLTDNTGNLILDIYKVMVKQPGGIYKQIRPVDAQSDEEGLPFYDGVDVAGVPSIYDKTSNGIFLDPIPNSSIYTSAADLTDGLKVYINREGVFFDYDDTTQKPGFAGLFHEYPALFACYRYAVNNGMKSQNAFKNEMTEMEAAIKKYYSKRERDVELRITGEPINSI